MADEQTKPPFGKPSTIPKGLDWPSLISKMGDTSLFLENYGHP